jgi:hypothetical protein
LLVSSHIITGLAGLVWHLAGQGCRARHKARTFSAALDALVAGDYERSHSKLSMKADEGLVKGEADGLDRREGRLVTADQRADDSPLNSPA